jgi:ring-opening amidohydrolase-like protein
MPEPIAVHNVALESVSDASGLADRAFREVLEAKGTRPMEETKQIPFVWSGRTDGVISPHATIFATTSSDGGVTTDEPRLTVGYAMSAQIFPEDIGRLPMVEKVAAGVKIAMERAGITDPADVHYVQTKTPLLTLETITDAKRRGKDVWTGDTLKSMDVSNSTTAWASRWRSARSTCRRPSRSTRTPRSTPRSPRARRGSSSTRPRSWRSATCAVSAVFTGSATAS